MNLNQEQSGAAESAAAKIVCIAGPGAGKSKTLCARIRHHVASGIDPAQIVAITFTNQAAGELRARLPDLLSRFKCIPDLQFCGTIHSFILQLLRRHGREHLGIPERLTVLTERQSEALLADVQRQMGPKAQKLPAKALWASLRREAIISGTELDTTRLVNFEYHGRMLQNGMLSFDAILHLGRLLAGKLMDAGLTACEALLVDEYQDVSAEIHELCLALPAPNKFFVADPDQSIYAWNGGDPALVTRLFTAPTWTGYVLHGNYRCGAAICSAANRLISHNKTRVAKEMTPAAGHEGKIDLCSDFADEASEMAAVTRALAAKAPEATAAVLCRTNFQVRAWVSALRGAGILVRERKLIEYPLDWEALKQFVSLMAQPDNDWLAYEFLCVQRGTAEADTINRCAINQMTSINALVLNIPANITAEAGISWAARMFSGPSVDMLSKVWLSLPTGATVAELGAALAAPDAFGEELGPEAGVTVTTIHAAKGREFDAVFVPGVSKVDREKSVSDWEESRRVLFVAVTRARSYVLVSCSRYGRQHEWQRAPGPIEASGFFQEL